MIRRFFQKRPVILITRPIDDAHDACAEARALGFAPLVAPCLRIVPLAPDLKPSFDHIQAIVLTSVNAVRCFPGNVPSGVQVFCVGDRTADAARARGFDPVVSAAGNIDDLEQLLADAPFASGGTILHVCGADVVRPMRVAGVRIDSVVAYRAEPIMHLPWRVRRAIRAGRVGAVSFFSARTGLFFTNTMKTNGLDGHCRTMQALCLSDSVVESVSTLPWGAVHVAKRPNRAAMVDLMRDIVKPVHSVND